MASSTIHERPRTSEPRERLAANGAVALSDSELIAILLRTGCVGANAVDVARQLIVEFGSLSGAGAGDGRRAGADQGRGTGQGRANSPPRSASPRGLARENLDRRTVETPMQVWDLLGAEMRALQTESLRVIPPRYEIQLIRVEEVFRQSQRVSRASAGDFPPRGAPFGLRAHHRP